MKTRVSPREGFTLIELLVVITIIAILAGIAVPAFTGVIERGNQTKDLSNAKQVYYGLKLYATDNDGMFPNTEYTPDADSGDRAPLGSGSNSNEAFKWIVPNYIQSEKIFYLAKSKWTPRPPDEDTSTGKNLEAGENNFAYVINLTDTSNPNFPIIADGFADGKAGTGEYSTDETEKGGIWKGKAAIVFRVDGSGKVEKVNTDKKVVGPVGTADEDNIFVTHTNWLASSQVAINPE